MQYLYVVGWAAYWLFWNSVAMGVRNITSLGQKVGEEADGKVVGFLHAVTSLLCLWRWPQQALSCSTGYFLWELIHSLLTTRVDKSMRFHAVMCFTGYALFLTHGDTQKMWWAHVFLIYEVSTIFMHIAWFMHKLARDSRGTFWAKALFFLTFLIFRVVFGTILTMHYISIELKSQQWTLVEIYHAVLIVSSWFLNLFWFVKLLRMLSSCNPENSKKK